MQLTVTSCRPLHAFLHALLVRSSRLGDSALRRRSLWQRDITTLILAAVLSSIVVGRCRCSEGNWIIEAHAQRVRGSTQLSRRRAVLHVSVSLVQSVEAASQRGRMPPNVQLVNGRLVGGTELLEGQMLALQAARYGEQAVHIACQRLGDNLPVALRLRASLLSACSWMVVYCTILYMYYTI